MRATSIIILFDSIHINITAKGQFNNLPLRHIILQRTQQQLKINLINNSLSLLFHFILRQ